MSSDQTERTRDHLTKLLAQLDAEQLGQLAVAADLIQVEGDASPLAVLQRIESLTGKKEAVNTAACRGAYIDGAFRYHLWRSEGAGARSLCLILLNPSIADAMIDDPTIRKGWGFARGTGFNSIDVLNAYAYRATDPKDLKRAGYPVGVDNDATIKHVLSRYVDRVIVGWGNHIQRARGEEIIRLIESCGHTPEALHVTNKGEPGHPLYLPYSNNPQPFSYSQEVT